MRTWLSLHLQMIINLVILPLAEQMAIDESAEKKKLPTWAIILIVVGGLVLCVIPACVILILMVMGPAIGNVFSNIIEEMDAGY